MKSLIRCVIVLLASVSFLNITRAQNALFTYQGRVTSNGTNFSGVGQFKFALVTSTNANHQATATANPPSGGFITIINVTFGGNGYSSPPTVTIFGGGGSGATAHANLSGGVVTSILVDNPGSGYSSTPSVTVAPPAPNITFTTYWSNDGTSVGGSEPSAFVNVPVNAGLFTVVLGDPIQPGMAAIPSSLFTQPDLQLRIWFNNGVSGFAVLNPPQNLTPAPYAIQSANAVTATTAGSANSVAAGNIVGNLGFSQLPPGLVTNSQSGVNFTGTFAGNGGALSNLSPNSLVFSGTNTSITFWGHNGYGQNAIPSGLNDATVLGLGIAHSLVLRPNGTLVGWGTGQVYAAPSNTYAYGQLIIPPGLSNVMAIAVGALHNVVIRSNGTVVAWGAGQTYNPTNDIAEYGQSIVPPTLNNVIGVGAGYLHSGALKSDRTVVCWGAGTTFDPTNSNLYEFGQSIVPPGLNGVAAISLGYAHSLALRTNGIVIAWGAGQAGGTNTYDFGQSVVPAGLNNVIAIAAGALHNLALKSDGTVVAWGAGFTNDLGVTGIHWGQSIVPPGLSNVVEIQAGLFHSLALKADGTVVAWGDNSFQQLAVPPGLNNVLKLGHGSLTAHNLVLRRHSTAPVAWLDSDNTFNGNIDVHGDLHVTGEITTTNGLRLNDANLWLRSGQDQNNGLGWYGEPNKSFSYSDGSPDGPVLFGNQSGALGTTTNTPKIALFWNASQQVGIGTTNPAAKLSLGTDYDDSKLLITEGGNVGYGIGTESGQFRFHLAGNSSDRFSFLTSPAGTEIFSISANGNVAMHGILSMGTSPNLYAPVIPENVRIIRGRINSNGSILFGTGFTVTHPTTGQYTVTFSPSYSDTPALTVTADSAAAVIATYTSVGPTSAGIRIWNTAGTGIDNVYSFVAIGQR